MNDDTTFKFETGNKSYDSTGSFNFNKVFWEFKSDTELAFEAYPYNLTSALQGKAYRFDNLNDWAVKKEGVKTPVSVHHTQSASESKTHKLAKQAEVEAVYHRRDGQIKDKDSFGRDPNSPKDRIH